MLMSMRAGTEVSTYRQQPTLSFSSPFKVEAARVLPEPGRGAEDFEGEEHGTKAGIDDHEEACSEAVEQLRRNIDHMLQYAAYAQRRERHPLRGGINADDCGLGKTNSTLLHIALDAERIEGDLEATPPMSDKAKARLDLRATFIIVPNNMVMTWARELMTNFKDVLDFSVNFGLKAEQLRYLASEPRHLRSMSIVFDFDQAGLEGANKVPRDKGYTLAQVSTADQLEEAQDNHTD
ncbi:hypothetical protein LTR24_006697 [Lithohypha guttulata]|uniref:SNF2 N-terminal domain-containing protein n=1 Tax=Lithohypha guttulata TaxID=1690604 RepID=A0ABR0K578_9EURO|nr:hypothetical protein LTR24_006697 [Lithohypha guttulata]